MFGAHPTREGAFDRGLGEHHLGRSQRRLRLSSTIAIEPALDMIERLQNAEPGVNHRFEVTPDPFARVDTDDAISRILALMPTLTQERPEDVDAL
ncbi:MAG: hypothetical protein HC897_19260, partial [Thermoanaerobaculia bacterium]|nr:hypothetical protein [Thermoanaerobaculia bacterium]